MVSKSSAPARASTTSTASIEVEIFDARDSLGTTTTDANGQWNFSINNLGLGNHTLTAKALSGNNPISPAWTIDVIAKAVPTITRIQDTKGEVPPGGTTTETRVTLSGTAEADEQVKILDNNVDKGDAAVSSSGLWSKEVTVALGAHSMKVRGLYDGNPESGARAFSVEPPTPPLVIDTATLLLNGYIVRWGRVPTTPPAGSHATRSASGGTPPYSYSISNDRANINASNGQVISNGNGSATVTVRDSGSPVQTASYSVTVSNVFQLDGWGGTRGFQGAVDHANSLGGHVPSMAEWRAVRASYGGDLQVPNGEVESWSTDLDGLVTRFTMIPNTGQEGKSSQIWGTQACWGIFVR